MSLRTKLLLFFLSISMLIIIVGLIFYLQLRNLIEPLTPESFPRGVEQLADVIETKEIINRLLYQQLLVEHNIENYVFTHQLLSLQKYYMNDSIFTQLLIQAKIFNPKHWPKIKDKYIEVSNMQLEIIKLMKEHKFNEAQQLLISPHYINAMQNFKNDLGRFFQQPISSIETIVAMVKIAVKNSHEVLEHSLNATLVIFFNAVIASILLVFLSTRAIIGPVNLLRENIEQMSVKKLDRPINKKLLKLKGEVGDLARAFSTLFFKLRAATVLRDELLTEIKQHKKTEKQLKNTATRLRETNLQLDQFAYVASHDLRAPLKAIESLANWIKEDCYDILPENSRQNFDLLVKRAQRLDMLIIGMLEYSRAIHVSLKPIRVDLNKLLPEIIDNLDPPDNIKIIIDTPMPIFKTHKTEITQVFLNLINNAIKYNDKEQGQINIGCEIKTTRYQFYIADNGHGIEEEFFEKIFEPFQTLQSRDVIESSGIGLAIVKKLVTKNHGKIWLKSALDQGTTFFFTWPK